MAKPNYQFEKRQRDLAKKQKQEDKRLQKLLNKTAGASSQPSDASDDDPSLYPGNTADVAVTS